MRFCKYCGNQISEEVEKCNYCGKALVTYKRIDEIGVQTRKTKKKIILIFILATVILSAVVCGIVFISHSGRCKVSGCDNKVVSGSDYCYNHKCSVANCNKSQTSYSNFCYNHHLMYDEDDDSYASPTKPAKAPVYDWELRITVTDLYTKYGTTYVEGTLKNESDSTVKFVTIKGAFQTYSGTTIDTDTTYAVGSEGLAPGESTKWKMFVSEDSRITKCDVTVIKYDY